MLHVLKNKHRMQNKIIFKHI